MRVLVRGAVGALFALACVLMLTGPVAQAELVHPFISSFEVKNSSFEVKNGSYLPAIAVDQSNGDVYVYEGVNPNSEQIDKFNSVGEKANYSALGSNELSVPHGVLGKVEIAVSASGPTAGDIYLADGGNVMIYGPDGSKLGELNKAPTIGAPWGEPCGVAVDPVGNVYVGLYPESVNKYAPSGNVVTNADYKASMTGLKEVCQIAADSEGDVYADTFPHGPVTKYGASQFMVSPLPASGAVIDPGGSWLAVDPSPGGDVYVDHETSVKQYSNSGVPLGTSGEFGAGALIGSRGVAIKGGAGGNLYAIGFRQGTEEVPSNALVEIFGPAVVQADVTTEAASGVTPTTATLNGTVNPDGVPVTTCQFKYGTKQGALSQTVACSPPPGGGGSPVAVSANLPELVPGTTYYFSLAATNVNGTNLGQEGTFATPPAVEDVSTGPAEKVTPTGAKLTGLLSPNGTDAHYYFQYGATTSYGSTSPASPGTDAGAGGSPVTAETTLSGLVAGTAYHYRLVAVNTIGATAGEDKKFTTAGPPQIRDEAAEVKSTEKAGQTTATLQAQVDPSARETTYHFEYGETTAYGTTVPVPDGTLGSGQGFVPTPAEKLSSLKIGTTYHYRIVAHNEYGTTLGPDQEFNTVTAALIEDSFAFNVAATSATLEAHINPLGSDTHYSFQYGATSCSANPAACTSVPALPVDIGSGESGLSVSMHLQGLTSGTLYHYRVVATNELGRVDGLDQSFTTQVAGGSSALPDGRAWEMVSPPSKQGSGLLPVPTQEGGLAQAAADGGAITYLANGPTEESPRGNQAPEPNQLFSLRGSGGWATRDIAASHANGPSGVLVGRLTEYLFFSSDLSLGLVEPKADTPLSEEASEKTPYLRHDATCEANPTTCYQPLANAGNVTSGAKFGGPYELSEVNFEGASPDMNHIIVGSKVPLTSSPGDKGGLYEWFGGKLTKVNVLPVGETSAPESGSTLGAANAENVRHAVSDNGSRVIWHRGSVTGVDHLYMRDMVKEETVRLDIAESGEKSRERAIFQTASGDGSRIFFTDAAKLTVDSTTREGRPDLYEFNTQNRKLTDLTVDPNAGESAGVQGLVLGASEDGAYVYFVANGALAPGAAPGDCEGGFSQSTSTCNLYVRHGGVTTFIAALSGEDGGQQGSFALQSKGLTARISPNGGWLAFMSDRSLTGYDNRDASSGVRDEEVFLYDAAANRLACASCNPTGARPTGSFDKAEFPGRLFDHPSLWGERWLAAVVPGWTAINLGRAMYQSRYLSDSGRLFFDSSDALTPRDTNGTWDVYEYQPEGVGDCTHASTAFSEVSSGCVGLISSGGSAEESAFVDASENGGEAFFLTASQLVPQDYDHSLDLYDARVCSVSSPCLTVPPAVPPACSTGDSCKPAPAPQPESFGAPSSETFSGTGNVSSAAPDTSVRSRSLTRAQKLARALRACRKKKVGKRLGCERQARRLYAGRVAGRPAARKGLPGRNGRRGGGR